MGVMSICIVNVIAYSNTSYMWTRVCFFLWPILLIIVAVRAAIMRESGSRIAAGVTGGCLQF